MDSLRRDILSGAIAPGTYLECKVIAARHGVRGRTALTALARLRAEGIVYFDGHTRYAAPAGPPDPAVNARLGTEFMLRREDAGLTVEQLAAKRPIDRDSPGGLRAHNAYFILDAESGKWFPREFWAELDHGLAAQGALLRMHDSLYSAASPASDPVTSSRVTTALAARIAVGEWPPGSRLPESRDLARDHETTLPVVLTALRTLTSLNVLAHNPGYYVPTGEASADPAPVAITVAWSNGTSTQLPLQAPAASIAEDHGPSS
jgi:DNA-binding GntR family transcriptional regulator